MNIYEENVLDHYKHPRGRGALQDATVTLQDKNPLCGDVITVQLHIENGVIIAARHESTGCAISQAGASMLFEQLEGHKAHEVLTMQSETILSEFGTPLSVSRVKCALLGLVAVKKALVAHAQGGANA